MANTFPIEQSDLPIIVQTRLKQMGATHLMELIGHTWTEQEWRTIMLSDINFKLLRDTMHTNGLKFYYETQPASKKYSSRKNSKK